MDILLTGKKYLVTGGAGFIGSHIAEAIAKQGKEVIIIDNFVSGKKENIEDWEKGLSCKIIEADITNYQEIEKHFANVDIVFHNAASKCTVCKDDPLTDLMTNARGGWNVFQASMKHKVKKVVHASTGSVTDIKSFYGASKLCAESYLKAFHSYYPELVYTVLRYYHVFGTRQDKSDKGGVIPIFIDKIINKKPITIYGDGSQIRFFTPVSAIVEANMLVAKNRSTNYETYAIANKYRMTILDLAFMLSEMLGAKSPNIMFKPDKPGDIKHFQIMDRLHLMDLGIETKQYLQETIDWYKEHN